MSEKLVFDYYYGREAEQFAFYRIPRMLIKDSHFSGLSNDAKMLYGLMLDRMSLSVKNEWQDENDRTYIIYTIEQIMEDLNCSKDKAVRVLSELDSKKGIGLVEKIRRGLGRPDIIYVKNFICIEKVPDETQVPDVSEAGKKPANPHKSTEVLKSDFKKSENQTSESQKTRLLEDLKPDFWKSENQTSGSLKTGLQEVLKSAPINNNKNNTDMNHINLTNQSGMKLQEERDRLMDMIKLTREMIKENIGYSDLLRAHPNDRSRIDELVEIMVEACTSEKEMLRIGKEDRPQVLVRSQFEKYNYSIMEYVLACLGNNTTKIYNIKNYLLTTLYNAPLTMDNYYSAEVNHDLYGDC